MGQLKTRQVANNPPVTGGIPASVSATQQAQLGLMLRSAAAACSCSAVHTQPLISRNERPVSREPQHGSTVHLTAGELRTAERLLLEEGVPAEYAALLLFERVAASEKVFHHAIHLSVALEMSGEKSAVRWGIPQMVAAHTQLTPSRVDTLAEKHLLCAAHLACAD